MPLINFVYLQEVFAALFLSLCIPSFLAKFFKWFAVYHFRFAAELGNENAAGQLLLDCSSNSSNSSNCSTAWSGRVLGCSSKQNCAQTGNNGNAASFPLLLKHTFPVVSHPLSSSCGGHLVFFSLFFFLAELSLLLLLLFCHFRLC